MQKIKIGKVVASFGLSGQIIIVHNLGKKSNFLKVKTLFIEQVKNNFIPYFVTNDKAKSTEENIITLDNINTVEATRSLLNKNIWLLQEDFDRMVAKKSAIALLHFIVFDNNKELGKVEEVIEQPHQILLTVIINNKEAYIPVHEDNVIKIDYNKRTINLDLPEGLLDIYT